MLSSFAVDLPTTNQIRSRPLPQTFTSSFLSTHTFTYLQRELSDLQSYISVISHHNFKLQTADCFLQVSSFRTQNRVSPTSVKFKLENLHVWALASLFNISCCFPFSYFTSLHIKPSFGTTTSLFKLHFISFQPRLLASAINFNFIYPVS